MSLALRNCAVATLLFALAACGSGGDKGAGRTAEGQVLEGSASDAMLPMDTVRSQAPLAPHEGSTATDKAKVDDSDQPAVPDRPADAPEAAPAAAADEAN